MHPADQLFLNFALEIGVAALTAYFGSLAVAPPPSPAPSSPSPARVLRARRGRLAGKGFYARPVRAAHSAHDLAIRRGRASLPDSPQSLSFPTIPHLRFKKVLRFRPKKFLLFNALRSQKGLITGQKGPITGQTTPIAGAKRDLLRELGTLTKD